MPAEMIRSRIESFATELTDLVVRSVLSEVQEVLGAAPARRMSRVSSAANSSRDQRPARPQPVSFEHYERMAVEHALADSAGDVAAAARLLGVGKSTFYRQLRRLGIARSSQTPTNGPPARIVGAPSLAAYERLALERALAESGGDKRAAAKLMRVGKSTMYRKLTRHGLG